MKGFDINSRPERRGPKESRPERWGSVYDSITRNVRTMYYDEGIIPTRESVSESDVTVRGRREGLYKCDGRWFRATTTASTTIAPDYDKIKTRLRITVRDAEYPRVSKSYVISWVCLGMPQEKGASHAIVMSCVKDFKDNYTR